jgi:hypothetical protein
MHVCSVAAAEWNQQFTTHRSYVLAALTLLQGCNCLYYRDAQKMLLVVADDKILEYTTRYPSSLCIVSWPTPPVFAHPLDYIPSQPWELSMQHAELGLSSRLQDELTIQDPSILSKK